MEKFRAVLEVLKKYHFWVLCGLIVVLSFGCWFLATGEQEKRFVTSKSRIDGQFTLVKNIAGDPEHPSDKYNEQLRSIEKGPLSNQVQTASERLYGEQRESNPLPKLFPDDNDQKEFEKEFTGIWRPMEEIAQLPPNVLAQLYRNRYREHIDDQFPKLFELIERRTEVHDQNDPGTGDQHSRDMRPMGLGNNKDTGAETRTTGIVDWVDAGTKIHKFLEPFARDKDTPSTLDVMMAQEDLWVYETLLKVIRNTNDVGSDPKHDPKNYQKPANHKLARIKQILAMDIGRDAIESWTRCERALFDLPNEGGGSAGPGSPVGPPGHGGPSQNQGVSLLADRYVDDKGKPLADPAQQPYREFRMMPIDLKVVIEQRDIPRLLAECANSAMRIDVRNVRILAETPPALTLNADASAGGSPAAGGETSPMAPMHHPGTGMHHGIGGMGDMGGHGSIVGSGGGGKGELVYDEESADPVYPPVPVEVQGIIYIYNPPREQNSSATAGGNGGQAQPAAAGPTAAPATMRPIGTIPAGSTPIAPATPATRIPPAPGALTAPAGPGALRPTR